MAKKVKFKLPQTFGCFKNHFKVKGNTKVKKRMHNPSRTLMVRKPTTLKVFTIC